MRMNEKCCQRKRSGSELYACNTLGIMHGVERLFTLSGHVRGDLKGSHTDSKRNNFECEGEVLA